MRGVRRGPVSQAQPLGRSRDGPGFSTAGARARRRQGGIAGHRGGADLARTTDLSQWLALRDSVRVPAGRRATTDFLLCLADAGDAQRAHAGYARRCAGTRAAAPAANRSTDHGAWSAGSITGA